MNKTFFWATGILTGVFALAGCSSFWPSQAFHGSVANLPITPEVGAVPERQTLDQGWSDQVRMDFWYTSQGSRIVPYTWFTWLEQKDSQELFRTAEHMELLRYLPMEASATNPAGLPIGFALDVDKKSQTAWLGLNCAACHTNQIDVGDTKILIDGAPTLGNFVLFFDELVGALNQTHEDDEKFGRFASKVLKPGYSKSSAAELRQQLGEVSLVLSERQVVNSLPEHYPDDFTSYARLDAFTNIQNAGAAFALGDLTNRNPPIAPVSYPFLWGTHQSDVVQWNASAPNTPVVGPLVRNIGEVVGVFGHLSIEKAPWWQRLFGHEFRYRSTVDMENLGFLELWVKNIRSPQWPERYLPPVKESLAAKGGVLYQQHCVQCHEVIPRSREGNRYTAVRTSVSEIGTDSDMAWYAENHMAKTLILEGSKEFIIAGPRFKAESDAIGIPVNGVVGIVLHDPKTALKAGLLSEEESEQHVHAPGTHDEAIEAYLKTHAEKRMKLDPDASVATTTTAATAINGDNTNASVNGVANPAPLTTRDLTGLVYKARPLNGIWATAPYLHNGSVPNLWQLLQKPADRVTRFWVGSRQFDPVHVGFVTNEGLNEFQVLNTRGTIQPGNSNGGHTAGTELTDEQKWQLIEYMKTL